MPSEYILTAHTKVSNFPYKYELILFNLQERSVDHFFNHYILFYGYINGLLTLRKIITSEEWQHLRSVGSSQNSKLFSILVFYHLILALYFGINFRESKLRRKNSLCKETDSQGRYYKHVTS